MDIVFEDKRDDPTIAALAAELDRYRAEGIPVYAATFGLDRPLRPEVGERVTPVQVPKKIDPLDRVTRFYDLTTGPPESQLTAVPTVFRDVCERLPGRRTAAAPIPFASIGRTCRRRAGTIAGSIAAAGRRSPGGSCRIAAAISARTARRRPTIPARILLDPTEEDDVAIEDMLDGSVVFYGAYYHGAADAMNTPLHNDLPAVFLHSAALDNLVTLGPQALSHSEPMVPLLDVSLPDFLLLAAIGGLFVVRRTSTRFDEGWERAMRRVRSRVGRVLLIAFGSQIGMLVLLAGAGGVLRLLYRRVGMGARRQLPLRRNLDRGAGHHGEALRGGGRVRTALIFTTEDAEDRRGRFSRILCVPWGECFRILEEVGGCHERS